MFRWLKERGRKGRKCSTDTTPKKEDDYGFRQKPEDYKRDLPPTPGDLTTAYSHNDEDRSFHIYEEIPDLPFRCTPEGEIRITLAREVANRRQSGISTSSQPNSQNCAVRNISPYMVVPLEMLTETPTEFRTELDSCVTSALNDGWKAEECGASSPGAQSVSPSVGSSVFGSPLDVIDRWGSPAGGRGDISDRLLRAINLTRLLTAIRLSSSSADTCTTSPICIGMDKDGLNISVSVTPTTGVSSNHQRQVSDKEGKVGIHHEVPDQGGSDIQASSNQLQDDAVTSLSNFKPVANSVAVPETHLSAVSDSGRFCDPAKAGGMLPATCSLRFLPSPSEHSALSEILQLKPGQCTALDPATIDAIILKLCEPSLPTEQSFVAKDSSCLHLHELGYMERMLKQMFPAGVRTAVNAPDQVLLSSAANSDTGYEYDVSTSSESDHTNYDYFLSKVAHTRSLGCEVKKLILSSGSSRVQSEDEEAGNAEKEFPTNTPTIIPTSHRQPGLAAVDTVLDSDEGTMADLSESENSSGYYESTTPGQVVETLPRAPPVGKAGRVGDKPRGHKQAFRRVATDSQDELSDIEVECYELYSQDADVAGIELASGTVSLDYSDPSFMQRVTSHRSQSASRTMPAAEDKASVTGSKVKTSKGKCSGGGRKCRHHHHPRSASYGRGRRGEITRTADDDDTAVRKHRLEPQDTTSLHCDNHQRFSNCNNSHMTKSSKNPTKNSKHLVKDSTYTKVTHDTYNKITHQSAKSAEYAPTRYQSHAALISKERSRSGGRKTSRTCHSPPDEGGDLPASFLGQHPSSDSSYQSILQSSQVYSFPPALPDPLNSTPGGGGRGLKGTVSVPSKLSVARLVPESSEVYGTRAGLQGCNNNRLLSDLIMLNYNRQVLNM